MPDHNTPDLLARDVWHGSIRSPEFLVAAIYRASASRAVADAEHLAEAAAHELVTLVRYLVALAEEAADEAPDADARAAETLAQETAGLGSEVVALVTAELVIGDKKAEQIADAVSRISESAIQTSYHANGNRGAIRSVVDAAQVPVTALRESAKTQIGELAGEPPAQLIEIVGEISAQMIAYLKDHPGNLHELSSRQFEKLIAEILASFGWEVQLSRATRDGGYDIFAITKDTRVGVRTSWLIECKKNARQRKVGVDIVRSLYGLKLDLRVANAMLATTSCFSRDAQLYKRSRYDLELKDYKSIIEWINTYAPNPGGNLYIRNNRLILPGEDTGSGMRQRKVLQVRD